jgi:hypothetical protein
MPGTSPGTTAEAVGRATEDPGYRFAHPGYVPATNDSGMNNSPSWPCSSRPSTFFSGHQDVDWPCRRPDTRPDFGGASSGGSALRPTTSFPSRSSRGKRPRLALSRFAKSVNSRKEGMSND